MKDNPKLPFKMYAAMIAAAITSIITIWTDAPEWVMVAGPAALAAIAVFLTPNPKIEATNG